MMIYAVTLQNGYIISDDRARLDMAFVHKSLSQFYWAVDRPRYLTDRSAANCLCFGVYNSTGSNLGFARVLTDYALRAHLADVFIEDRERGLGLGKALIETILAHPKLATVTHWTLSTADAQHLYFRYGFRAAEVDQTWMTMVRST